MALPPDARIILAQAGLKRQIRERLTSYARMRWTGLGAWRDSDVDRFVADVTPKVLAGQRQVAQITSAYLDAMARQMGLTPRAVPGTARGQRALSLSEGYARGIPVEDVYRRPAMVMRYALSEGDSLESGLQKGAERLGHLIASDMQMANVRSAFEKLRNDERVIGWERVLTSGNPCALCILASTQRYRREDLAPIHDTCSCEVEAIYGQEPIGQVINEDRLDALKPWLAEQELSTSSGFDALVSVKLHGELGPVLTWKGQAFRGPNDLF